LAGDFPITITAMPINPAQRKAALVTVIILLGIGVATAPFADSPAPRVDAFIPVLQTCACLVDLITAILLFSQYWIRPSRATLAIACGFVFSGLFAFAQTLAFPGGYSASGAIGDGLNTAAWLFVLWHTAFPSAVIVYALARDIEKAPSLSGASPTATIIKSFAMTVAATIALTWLACTLPAYLPTLYHGSTQQTGWANAANIYLWLLNNVALVLLFVRRQTILDLWLMVTLFAWWPNFLSATFFTVVRFSLGWYISRCFAVAASSTLLLVMLSEMTVLYARLASTLLLLRRERADRLVSIETATGALAHEIRQPLAGIASLGDAGLKWLKKTPPDVEKAEACLTSITNAAHRCDEIITSVRRLFKRAPDHRTAVQLNDASRQVMRLAQHDLLANGISVTAVYQDNLPALCADYMQLQQVILNLVENAIDAVKRRPFGQRRLRLATGSDGNFVSFYIHDSGAGVAEENRERIFNAFFTTKSSGTGLGLAICRTIIEEHGGTLRLENTSRNGSTFEIALPIMRPAEQA
jgi:signal transduction histidine kinase